MKNWKPWQKAAIGCGLGITVPIALAAGCLMIYAIAIPPGAPTPVAAAPAATIAPPTPVPPTPVPPTAVPPTAIPPAPTVDGRAQDLSWAVMALPNLESIAGYMDDLAVLGQSVVDDTMLMFDQDTIDTFDTIFALIAFDCSVLDALEPGPATRASAGEINAACDDLAAAGDQMMTFFATYEVDYLNESSDSVERSTAHMDRAAELLPADLGQ